MDGLGRLDQPTRAAVTYTQNWPHEPLVGNTPTGSAVVWSVISFVLLLAGIGGMVWYFAAQERRRRTEMPTRDPLLGLEPTPSQRATVKYFFVVAALFVVQVGFGAIAAHYGVEGSGFYGIPWTSGCRMRWLVPGIRNLACSGLPPRGWQPVCMSPPPSVAMNHRGNGRV